MYTHGTELIECIVSYKYTVKQTIGYSIRELINHSSDPRELILKSNTYNVNALMATACIGHYEVINLLLCYLQPDDVNIADNTGETALTLAIKRRGFDKTIKYLINAGAKIPANRRTSLLKYAHDNKYTRTAKLLDNMIEENNESTMYEVDETMSNDFIMMQYAKSSTLKTFINRIEYFEIALLKLIPEIVEELLLSNNKDTKDNIVNITLDHLLDYTIPPKT